MYGIGENILYIYIWLGTIFTFRHSLGSWDICPLDKGITVLYKNFRNCQVHFFFIVDEQNKK